MIRANSRACFLADCSNSSADPAPLITGAYVTLTTIVAAARAPDGPAAIAAPVPTIIGTAIAVTAATRRIAASSGAGCIVCAICRLRFK